MKINSRNIKLNANIDEDNLTVQTSFNSIEKIFNEKKAEYDIEIEKNKIIRKQYYRALNYMKGKNKKNYLKKNEVSIKYEIKNNENKIRLFGSNFFMKNKDFCKIKINGEKENDLMEFIEIDHFSNEKKLFILKFKWSNGLTDLSYMFADCSNLISISNIENLIDVEITNLSNLFRNCISLVITPNFSKCNTDYVENMSSLFRGCKSLKEITGISNWDTSKVTKMTSLFYNCENLEKCPDISKWNTSKVTNFSGMFYNCSKLKELPDISNWNTKNVISMSLMFYGCESLSKLPDISKWETTKLKSLKAIFYGCKNIEEFPNISKWNSNNITDISAMFYNCESITSLPNIFNWKLNNFTDISNLFYNCKNLILKPIFSFWDFSNVIDMSGFFYGCTKLEDINDDFANIKTNNVTNLSFLFYNCTNLKRLPNALNWDTKSLKNMQGMFYNCKSLTELPDISDWDTSELKDISYLFYGCESLKNMPDISKWNTYELKNARLLFYNCKSLTQIPDITKWDTSKVIDKKEMLYGHSSIKEITDTSNLMVKKFTKFDKIYKNKKSNVNDIIKLYDSNNQNLHYLCNRCHKFPYIKFCKDRKYIRLTCSCNNNKKILINEFFNNYSSFANSSLNINDENDIEINLLCKKHKKKFKGFSKIFLDNYCQFCIDQKNDNDNIITFDYMEREDENILRQIKNGNSKIFEETNINSKFKNIITKDKILSKNEEEEFNILIKIIISDYKNYPNFVHFFNIKNLLYFFKIEGNSTIEKKEKELNNKIFENNEPLIIEYNNNISYKTKLFSKTFVKNNKKKIKIEIEGERIDLIEEYEFKTKEEKVRIKLFINNGVSEIDMYKMFANCTDLINVDGISKLKEIQIINMDKMFYNCISLKSIPDINDWEIEKYNNYLMFYNCISLIFFPYEKEINFNKYDDSFLGVIINKYLKFNKEIAINNYDEDNEGYINLFGNKYKIKNKEEEIIILDGKNEDELIACYKDQKKDDEDELIALYKNNENDKFEKNIKIKIINKIKDIYGLIEREELNLSKWNTENVTNMSYLFFSCYSLSSLPDISKWNTENVINMNNMFYNCKSLLSLPDISNWNTENVVNMNNMFDNCKSLLSLPDISNWNTENVINMKNMFYNCKSLLSLPDISKWNTNNITNISYFSYIMDIISFKGNSKDKKYFKILNQKFENFVQNEINSLAGEKLNESSKILSRYVDLLYKNDKAKKTDFLERKIGKLDKRISFLIYNELIRTCQGEEYKNMKEFIYKKYLDKIDNIDNIISLIDSLSKEDKNKFLEELMEKCKFTTEEFYSNNNNIKINLLCELQEKEKLKISHENNFYGDIEDTLVNIRKEMDGDINKPKLEEFLNNGKDIAIKRLGLIKMIFEDYEPEKVFNERNENIKEINNKINQLRSIKDSLFIFHRNSYIKEITKITKIIENIQKESIKNYKKDNVQNEIESLKELRQVYGEVNSVKSLLLFKIIYDEEFENDQNKHFCKGIEKLKKIINTLFDKDNCNIQEIYENNKKIFDKIKDIVSNNESKADLFIDQMIDYYIKEKKETKRAKEIKEEKKEVINDLMILFKSKKYEIDLKSMISFFESFNPNDQIWNKTLPKEYEALSKIDLEELKKNLNQLKAKKIYDYEQKSNYFNLFTVFYEKREALDFLLSKTDEDIKYLYDKITPANRIITIKSIENFEKCIKILKKFREMKNNFDLFEYIKKEFEKDNEQIFGLFESYSNNYTSIIEIDINDDLETISFEKVNNFIKNSNFIFTLDNEEFSCGDNKEEINLEELINLKNKIYIKSQKKEKETDSNKLQFQIKCEKLVFFKENISNLEKIYNYMKDLRIKGCCLPILIIIKMKYPNTKYYLNKIEKNSEEIKYYLFRAKMEQMNQLDSIYKEYKNLRFLYGKLFRKINMHLDSGYNIFEIMRYILNKTNNDNIIEGVIDKPKIPDDYVEEYKDCIKYSYKKISNYITSLFKNNGISLKNHYENMQIIDRNKYKGFYLHECKNGESMEEFIVNIFLQKIGHLPIAQNVLIFSKETSFEEIHAFFYRSILCDYNTLFVVELNHSFSDIHQAIMDNYIVKLLSYKNQIYNESQKENKANRYLNSCIVFVYDENIKDNSFLTQIGKVGIQEINIEKFDNNIKKNELKNILVISSDICGLGKSHKIKKMILTNKEQYYHFPIGGELSKTYIFEKLSKLLNKIEKEKGSNYEKVAIHLDLTESKETSIINEFLFSFLITKFYINNDSIIYIPKEIKIYIEIPNSFDNYLSKFGILKIFNNENISLKNIPDLDLPNGIINTFNQLLELNSNKVIERFIKKYIGNREYSYHQIIIFIKLFLSEYSKLGDKLLFVDHNEDVTEECIKKFSECTRYFTEGGFANLLTENKESKKIDYIDSLSYWYENDLINSKFPYPLIFTNKQKKEYIQLEIPDKNETRYRNSKDYLNEIKRILNLPNDVEKKEGDKKSLLSILNYKTNNYVITDDNFKKMILLIYRIKANIPVIIMGETGCGKTALVTKLNQLLNNGEITLSTINIYPGINEKDICKKMNIINEDAKKVNDEKWVFFDEINTCQCFSLLNEIFINRSFNGEKLNDNIRLIGSCNPYRKRKVEKYGLSRDHDNDSEYELVYLVQPLPQSLLYYVFSFGSINEEDEKKYIYSIIEQLFAKEEKKLHEITRDAIFECHKYLRENYDYSIVSLREISRFSKCVYFFQKYFSKKDEYLNIDINDKQKLYKIKSIICSIYLCYYIRLNNAHKRANFDIKLKETLLNLINVIEDPEKKIDQSNNKKEKENQEIKIIKNGEESKEKEDNLFNRIIYKKLKNDLRGQEISHFSDFLKLEEDFLLNLIDLSKGIGKNNLLKENVFLIFLSVMTKIPLIIIGKPGTGKSLSAQLVYNSLKGKYSKQKFFKNFPSIIQTYFQGSGLTNPEEVEKLFQLAENKYKYFSEKIDIKKENLPISMILFDELGLAEKSKSNPLKILYSKLDKAEKEGISFIGISNYSLDAVKIKRALTLSVPDLEESVDELINTSKSIAESISEDMINYRQLFEILAKSYYEYKNTLRFLKELTVLKELDLKNNESKNPVDLSNKDFYDIKRMKEYINLFKKEKKIKEDFHGNRDFYYFIKEIAMKISRLSTFEDNEVKDIIERYIERNFGGIDYEIDIDFDYELNDIKTQTSNIKKILEGAININKNGEKTKDKKFSSVYLFKKVYNKVCWSEYQYKIKDENCKRYDLNRCIVDNINDINSRYLLVGAKPTLSSLINQIINVQNPDKTIELYDGSPFLDDNNKEYIFRKLNEILDDAISEKTIILQNLNQIQLFLFDLYNKNYIIKDDKKYARICFGKFDEQLAPVNDSFRIIILVNKKLVNEYNAAFLSRFEKIEIDIDRLLDDEQTKLTKSIIEEINLKYFIDNYQKKNYINYNLKDLLINCRAKDIQGLIYYYSLKNKNNNYKYINEEEIRENVYNKISKILPQDIILILPESHIIKQLYYDKHYYNFKQYINDKNYKDYKISIIYTFSRIINIIEGSNYETSFFVSEIRNENQLKMVIEEIKCNNENNKLKKDYNLLIHFEKWNSYLIQFISDFIISNFKDDKYKYIFIIHLERNFDFNKKERIYSIPDINPDINILFIDNLNGSQIESKDLLKKDIKSIMDENDKLMDLENEFKRSLIIFVNKELNEKNRNKRNYNDKNSFINEDNYCEEILKYMDVDKYFKQKIIEKAKKLIEIDKGNFKNLIDKIFININKNSLDIISCLLEYIKEKIFSEYLIHIFEVLENNNILTTLVENKNGNNNNLDEDIITQLKGKFLDSITMDKNFYEPKFLFNYKIPGCYNFYEHLSNYISKNISVKYLKNEQNLREYIGKNIEKVKQDFHENEERLLSEVYDEINQDKFIYDVINIIPTDLILKDYITYFVKKYIILYTELEFNNNLINLLLNLRFDKERNEIIKNNMGNHIKIMLIKIMWIESNINYISKILEIFKYAKELFSDDGEKLYNLIKEKIKDENEKIRYITNENRNPEHTREVNECYYIFFASICLIITSNKMKLTESLYLDNNKDYQIEVNLYNEILKKINQIFQKINFNLNLFSNEIYIIDELIEIIEFQKLKKIDIEKIQKIREYLRKYSEIIQKNLPDKANDPLSNLDDIYREFSIPKEVLIKEDKKYYDKYYDTLRNIFYKEINKVTDINYRIKILEYLIKEKDIIKKSNSIFQILLNPYIKEKKNFKQIIKNLLEGEEQIINVIENNLIDSQQDIYFSLRETLLYLFEKNSFIYLRSVLYDESEPLLLEAGPMEILKKCCNSLQDFIEEDKKDENDKNNKFITKLFCLGYIRVFCYFFIKLFDEDKSKFKEPEKMIESFNSKEPIYKMIRLYIYRILYNRYQKDVFLNLKWVNKYKLDKYVDLKGLMKFNEHEQIKYEFEELYNDNSVYKKLEKYQKDNFENEINKEEFDDNLDIDNFYIAASNLILLRLKEKDFETSEIFDNFYKNVCKPLFGQKKYSKLLEFMFNPKKYIEIKKEYEINSQNIEALLYGYRYCLNELSSNEDDDYDNHDYIYSIDNLSKTTYLSNKYYPGADITEEPYYELYSKIINHFKYKPNEGCYVCLCNKGFYHSVPSGFPGILEKNIKCPYCCKDIGSISKEKYEKESIGVTIVKRKNYYRIFKDDYEIDSLKSNKAKGKKLKEINYMTLKEFKEKFITPLYMKEKGLSQIDKNYFFKDNKIVRNLSQISYRLLNYILYSHLFFAKLFTNSNNFDKYIPKNMFWIETLNECFILLKNELSKKGIHSIEIFMNYIFKDLFTKLVKKESINNYEELLDFENSLEILIQENIKKSAEEIKKYNEIIKKNDKDKNSFISLLEEKYENYNYQKPDFPYYEYFYYSDYLDEDYIMNKILSHKDCNEYPLLSKYLKNKKEKKNNKDNYSLDKLSLFNKVLNLIYEQYSHKVTRKYAEEKLLKDTEIYKNSENAKLINRFIKFYNRLNMDNNEGKKISLNIDENTLSDFVVDDNNEFGRSYIKIYKIFIKKQNEELENLLDIKISEGIFNNNCKNKIYIHQIKEDEIFNFNLSDNFLIKYVFNRSYRKIIDTHDYKDYNHFEINLNDIEENLTELLLQNKKLLNEETIVEFTYNNEVFENEIKDMITLFKNNYIVKDISLYDKNIIDNFIKNNDGNIDKYQDSINDFMTLIQYLNNIKKGKKGSISENSLIYYTLKNIEDRISPDFSSMFEEKEQLTVNKISDIFNYYLKLIFKYIKKEIEKYQVQNGNGKRDQLDEKTIKQLDAYFEEKKFIISKKDLENAIRIFISLVLYREKDKENKIKLNHKNLIDYLKSPDLWDHKKYKKQEFNESLYALKLCNIKINQTLWLYNYLVGNEETEEYIKNKNNNSSSSNSIDNESNNNNEDDEKLKRKSISEKKDSNSDSESTKE